MLTVLTVFGTRPEAIKMVPIVRELERHRERVRSVVCSTGQHREMVDQVCALFDIRPDIDLNLMQPDQTLASLTARMINDLDPVVQQVSPDWILAQGDTTTVLVTALVAHYSGVRFGHVEAGLRTGNPRRPFPEEINRRWADAIATLLFAPTDLSRQNLLREGYPEEQIVTTGNTVVDAMQIAARMPYDWARGPLAGLPTNKRLVLVTAHRRESLGEPLHQFCLGVRDVAETLARDGVHFIYPVHPNPRAAQPARRILGSMENVTISGPLDYLSLVHVIKRATLVLTDSGGIQEEIAAVGVPVLVTRDETERPEGLLAGIAKLVGTSREKIAYEVTRLLQSPSARDAMVTAVNPYGDGKAAQRIVAALLE